MSTVRVRCGSHVIFKKLHMIKWAVQQTQRTNSLMNDNGVHYIY